jgi:hypothetical protein
LDRVQNGGIEALWRFDALQVDKNAPLIFSLENTALLLTLFSAC